MGRACMYKQYWAVRAGVKSDHFSFRRSRILTSALSYTNPFALTTFPLDATTLSVRCWKVTDPLHRRVSGRQNMSDRYSNVSLGFTRGFVVHVFFYVRSLCLLLNCSLPVVYIKNKEQNQALV